MIEQEVVDYITLAQKHGLSDFEIKQNLLNAGWEAGLVEESFVFAKAAENKTQDIETGRGQGRQQASMAREHQKLEPQQAIPSSPLVQNSSASITVTDLDFKETSPVRQPVLKKPALWIILGIFLILAAGCAYGYYNYVYLSPTKIWDRFLQGQKASDYNSNFAVSYSDQTTVGSASTTQTVGISFTGNANVDDTDHSNPKSAGKLTVDLNFGVFNFNILLNYELLSKIFYLDISQIPQLKALLPDNNIQWVKFDFAELQNYAKTNGMDFSGLMAKNDALKTQLGAIWAKASPVTTTSYMAKETLNGTPVYHLKNQFDSPAFSAAILNSLDLISAQTASGTKLTSDQRAAATALLQKIQVRGFDVWIGQKDNQLYQLNLTLNAPSVKDLTNPSLQNSPFSPLGQANAKSRDAKRLADIRQMSSALELYYNDNGGYPGGISGVPQNVAPTYISIVPTAPLPSDGNCSDYYNTYWYTPQGKAFSSKGQTLYPTYTMTFCLGSTIGGYQAGIAELTEKGINDNLPCPVGSQNCSPTTQQSQNYTDLVKQMDFGGELKIDITNSDFGQTQSIVAPTSSTDILDLFKAPSATSTTTIPAS